MWNVARSAHRHGIAEDDMRHALRQALRFVDVDDMTMWIGPSRTGKPLEIGVVQIEGEPWIVHANEARPKYLR